MRLRYLAVLLLVITPLAAQLTHVLSPELIYSNSRASVVTVLTFDASRAPLTQGSGFIVANNRVVTNYHVVAGCSSASLVFADGTISIVTAVISASEPKDLVVLEAETGNRLQLFDASKEKHTGAEQLDVSWGLIVAEYYAGDRKDAKSLHHFIKKSYPEFLTTATLKQLPLVWSDATLRLIDAVAAGLR